METFAYLFRFDLEEVSGLTISCTFYEQYSECKGIGAGLPWSISIFAFLLAGGSGVIGAMVMFSIDSQFCSGCKTQPSPKRKVVGRGFIAFGLARGAWTPILTHKIQILFPSYAPNKMLGFL